MEFTQISLLFIFVSTIFLLIRPNRKLKLPPSPAISLPVIGHLHLLKPLLHRVLLSFSHSIENAPIFHLRLGTRLVYVVTSRSLAEECFTKHDVVLADRPVFIVSKHIGYNATHMIAAPYGDHWRNLRRIASVEIFSTHRLNTFLYVRNDEIRRLISRLSRDSSQKFAEVELKELLGNLSSNNIIRMVAGKRYYDNGEDNDEAKYVRELVSGLTSGASAGNPADYLPIVRWLTNFEKNIKKVGKRFDAVLQGLVDEKRAANEKGQTMIDHLLSLQETQPEYYTDVTIKGMILSMLSAGTDTSSITLEWAMSNLLNHPELLEKARTEIDNKIGFDRLIEESDITNLPYLQNIVSETQRLYPAVPLLLPHMASKDCNIAGYDMPRGTILLANAWAMHRDAKLWEEPERFKPERFEKEGEIQKLITFGIGRRACPGVGLAQRLVTLTLGRLVQCFEWERVGEELVDMTEEDGVTLPKRIPLRAMCKARSIVTRGFVEVEMKSLFTNLTSTNILRMFTGKQYYGEGNDNNDEAKHARQLVAEVVTGLGAGNLADYLSVLRWFTSFEKRMQDLGNRFDAFLQSLVDEKRAAKEKSETMIDHLLSLQEIQPDYYTDDIIKGLLLSLVVAGTETSAVTLEWAMSNLLNHPEVLKKARIEIDEKVGLDRLVEEKDIVNLTYLQNIMWETLRLHPAIPILLPHLASEDCKVGGYDMPRGTMVLIDAWAMHRDPKSWEDPEMFKPERFEKEGEAKKLMSFGMGRRACPGAGLAQRLMSLALGSLVQCFEWERVGKELVDMNEAAGATLPKAVPLRTMCKSRSIVAKMI